MAKETAALKLEQRTRLTEVLLRFHPAEAADMHGVTPDGRGAYWAAHQRHITEIVQDGVVIHAAEGHAQPLAAEDIGHVLGEVVAQVSAERDMVMRDMVALQQKHNAAVNDLATARDEHAATREQRDEYQGHRDHAHGQLAEANQRIADLTRQLAEVVAERDALVRNGHGAAAAAASREVVDEVSTAC